DDEIDEINQRISNIGGLSDQLATLTSQLSTAASEASAAKSSATSALDAATKAAEAAKSAGDAADLAAAQAEVAKNTAEAAAADAKAEAIKAAQDKVEELQKTLSKSLSDAQLEQVREEVKKLVSNVNNLLGTQLTSLVFKPNFYWWGIEAMPAMTFNYTALTVKKVDANNDYSKDAPTAAKTATSVTPGLVADYHLNPSTVDIKNIKDLSFIVADKAYTTRAESKVVATVTGKELLEPGLMRVHAALTGGALKDISTDEEVTVLALQAHYQDAKSDTIVTSDYAAVKQVDIKDLVLANAQLNKNKEAHEVGAGHLWTTAADAIAGKPEIQVVWNSEGIDVAEYVQTHYTTTEKADTPWDVNANDGIVAKDGFVYSYELVGYLSGDNKTSESAHAALNGSVLRPQITKDGKQQAFGYDQSQATIGRKPLVRVILTDTNSNKIAAVGYILVEITAAEEETEDAVTTIDPFKIDDAYTVSCSTDDLLKKLKWHEVEELILAKLEVSKDYFEANYKLDDNNADAKQFNETTAKAKEVKKIGKVSKTTTDTEAHQTEVLQWAVGANEAYEAFTKQATIKAIVRFVKENANGSHHYVYVTFDWTPATRNVTPAGTIDDATAKLDYAWYASNTTVAKSGYAEIHQNVKVPNLGETSDDCTYENDILNAFVGNKVTISGVDKAYADFQADKLDVTFKFIKPAVTKVWGVGQHNQYLLEISEDGLTMNATKLDKNGKKTGDAQAVAVLDGSVIKYQETEYAKDVLNYAGRNQMGAGETLAGRIGIEAVNGCDKELALTNNAFDVKFIRPIEIGTKDNDGLRDAVNDGDNIAFDKIIAFRDWRNDDKMAIFSPEGYNYYEYYGINAIEVDTDNITCDLNNGTLGIGGTLLSAMSKNIVITFDAPTAKDIAAGKFGQLNYKNNGNEVGTYHISIPVKVSYKWGVIEEQIVVTVHGTI
ncbi:MAG: hypothetical protein IJ845_03385, partial [Bacteroidaceae bacterium]|nr:hypothetical protein [Bacteroidaceae bacterium]